MLMIRNINHQNFAGCSQEINMINRCRYFGFMLVPLLYSCDNTTPSKKPKKTSNYSVVRYDTIQLTDDKYIAKILAWNDPYKRLSNDNNSMVKRTLVKNDYDDNITDTIITYNTSNADSFTYYVSGDTAAAAPALMKFKVNSSSVILPSGIHSDITKADFYRPLPSNKPNLVVAISEQEGYQNLHFVFQNDTLKSIQFESSYLD